MGLTPLQTALRGARLYGILDLGYVGEHQAVGVTRLLLDGGIQVLQLRAKNHPPSAVASLGRQLAPLCRERSVPFLLNDHPALVRETGADGAHVGQKDLSVAAARALAGPGALIGKSTHSVAQAMAARAEGADYIGFGPLFATPTKPDYTPIGLADVAAAHAAVDIPIFCIGGIKQENLPDIVAAGARRVVIVSGLLQAEDIPASCRACRAVLE